MENSPFTELAGACVTRGYLCGRLYSQDIVECEKQDIKRF